MDYSIPKLKYKCICGSSYLIKSKIRHTETKKHLLFINKNIDTNNQSQSKTSFQGDSTLSPKSAIGNIIYME